MRRILSVALLMVERLTAGIALWVPMLLLGAWSLIYLVQVAFLLAAPGVPVQFQYQAPGGRYTLRAKSYAVFPISGLGTLTDAELRDPAGVVIASVARANAFYEAGRIKVQAYGGFLRAVRTKKIPLSLLNAFPQSEGESRPLPWLVRGENLQIRYEDQTAMPFLAEELRVAQAEVSAAENRGAFSGSARFSNGLPIAIHGVWQPDGRVEMNFRTDNEPVMPHWPAIRRWLASADWNRRSTARSIHVSGDARVVIIPKQPVRYNVNADVVAVGLRAMDYTRSADLKSHWRLVGNQGQVDGSWTDGEGGGSIRGLLDWENEFSGSAQVMVRANSLRSLPPPLAKIIPPRIVGERLAYAGPIRWQGKRVETSGLLRVGRAKIAGQTIESAEIKVRATHEGLVAKLTNAKVLGSPVTGSLSMRYGGEISASLRSTETVSLGKWARQAGLDGLSGDGRVVAVVNGTVKNPNVIFDVKGRAAFRHGELNIPSSALQIRGTTNGRTVQASRMVLRGPAGTAVVTGSVDLKSNQLNLAWAAGGIALKSLARDVSGFGEGSGKIGGTTSRPVVDGEAHVLAPGYQDRTVASARAKFRLDRDHVVASALEAANGPEHVVGHAELNFHSKQVKGEFTGDHILIGEWLPEADVNGEAKISRLSVDGTLDNPKAVAEISTESATLKGVSLDRSSATLRYEDRALSVSKGIVRSEGGEANFAMHYDLDSKRIRAKGTFQDFPLAALRSVTGGGLDGMANGSLNWDTNPSAQSFVQGKLAVHQVHYEGFLIGDGNLDLSYQERIWKAAFSIGTESRFAVSEGLQFNDQTQAIKGNVDVLNLPIEEILLPIVSRVADLPPNIRELVRTARGNATARLEVTGDADHPIIAAHELVLGDLVLAGRAAGRIDADLSYGQNRGELKKFAWRIGTMVVGATGLRREDGTVHLDGHLENFDLTWLRSANPDLALIPGSAGAELVVDGPIDNLTARGSADVVLREADSAKEKVSINLNDLSIENKVLTLEGRFGARTLSGRLIGRVPFSSLNAADPHAEPLRIEAIFEPRNLKSLSESFSAIDPKKTTGQLAGNAVLAGFSDDLDLSAHVELKEGTVGFKDATTTLEKLGLVADYRRDALQVDGHATGGLGGDIAITARAILPNIFTGGADLAQVLNEGTIRGSVNVRNFVVKEFQNKPDQRIAFKIPPSQLTFDGIVAAPTIKGAVHIADFDGAIASGGDSEPMADGIINPIFDRVQVVLDNPAKINSSATTLRVEGDGLVQSVWNRPQIRADLSLVDGTFTLPNARVALEEGGQIQFRYDAGLGGTPEARLDLNLEGRTSVTARRLGEAQRYDVVLGITGNLFESGGLQLRASSDPPDLSQQEVLAILGQRDVIEQIARGAQKQDSGFRDAALSLALPSLSGGLTRGIAGAFGLDYFSVDYDAFDQATFSAAKTFNKQVTLSARRQLNSNSVGKTKYEVRLTYRVPSRNRLLSSLRFGFGFDQDRPWKFSIGWSKRI